MNSGTQMSSGGEQPDDDAHRPSNRLYRRAFEQSPAPAFMYDTSLEIVDCNEAMARRLGVTRDRIIGIRIESLGDERHRQALRRALDGEIVAFESHYRAMISDLWLPGSATFVPVRDEEERVVLVMVLFTDPSTPPGLDEPRRSSEMQLGEAQRLGRVGSWVWDVRLELSEASPEFYRILGAEPHQLRTVADFEGFIDDEDRPGVRAHLAKVIAARLAFTSCDFRIRHPDARTHWVVMRAEIKYAADGRPLTFSGTLQDETERRELEQQLVQAQRMDALGQLASGVAHDFNNLLPVIRISADLIGEDLPRDSELLPEVSQIQRAAEHAGGLTRQLLAFSRKQILRPRRMDLNALVNETTSMLQRLIGANVELAARLDPTIPPVLADPGQMQQVLLNLAVNARDAMPDGGVLMLETSATTIGDDNRLLPRGEYVTLSVADTGHGMDESLQRLIFDPFFTTKPPGKGTGLGLSTVRGIVERSRGRVSVDSRPGHGTRVTIHLPRATGDRRTAEHAAIPASPTGAVVPATILLVEDDRSLRAVFHRMLERAGYAAIVAEDGYEALAVAESFSGTIDLLVTDIVLPGLGGHGLATRLTQRRPGLRVLYMTGYIDDAVIRRGLVRDAKHVLEKPFNATELAAALRETLEDVPPEPGW